MLEVGRGKKEPEWVKEILESEERVAVGPKLPAKGLTLIGIQYENFEGIRKTEMGNSWIIFQKLLVLFGFMLLGTLGYKRRWISDEGASQISRLIVNIFNPALIITGITSSEGAYSWTSVLMNILLAVILFASLIVISPLFVRILRVKKNVRNMYSVMLIFSNLGFMGIPLIEALYSRTAVFYVGMYTLVFNILFYTYGFYLFEKEKNIRKSPFSMEKTDQSRGFCMPGFTDDFFAAAGSAENGS